MKIIHQIRKRNFLCVCLKLEFLEEFIFSGKICICRISVFFGGGVPLDLNFKTAGKFRNRLDSRPEKCSEISKEKRLWDKVANACKDNAFRFFVADVFRSKWEIKKTSRNDSGLEFVLGRANKWTYQPIGLRNFILFYFITCCILN